MYIHGTVYCFSIWLSCILEVILKHVYCIPHLKSTAYRQRNRPFLSISCHRSACGNDGRWRLCCHRYRDGRKSMAGWQFSFSFPYPPPSPAQLFFWWECSIMRIPFLSILNVPLGIAINLISGRCIQYAYHSTIARYKTVVTWINT